MNRLVLPNSVMLGEVKQLLLEGREVVIMTKGVSMLPFIVGNRDSVLLCRKESLVPGDIALAEIGPGVYVLHRVIEVGNERITLKGDGNLRGTETCSPGRVCGVVKEVIRPGDRRYDPSSPGWRRKWKCWKFLPCIARRGLLWLRRKLYGKQYESR